MNVREFFIGYAIVRQLRPLAECEQERAALSRLHDCRGTEADLLLAASMFARAGAHGNAEDLLRAQLEEVA